MKIAVITDDSKTVSQHFGRAAHYLVATVENGQIISRELRDKLGHGKFHGAASESHEHGEHHGHGAGSQEKHLRMSDAIRDCEALLCGGMGRGAYENIRDRGIRPVVTDLVSIDEAVMAYVEGRIIDLTDRLH